MTEKEKEGFCFHSFLFRFGSIAVFAFFLGFMIYVVCFAQTRPYRCSERQEGALMVQAESASVEKS